MSENERYPIGRFQKPTSISTEDRVRFIESIAALPSLMRRAVENLSSAQIDTPYRPGGWTIRQVVHHVADSHINSFVRFKLALTEDAPTIKPYDEALWAELDDSTKMPTEISLMLLEALHERWVRLLSSLDEQQFARTFVHSERGVMRLDEALAMYAWHGKHHLAHIASLARTDELKLTHKES